MHVNIFSNGDIALHCDAEIHKESHYIALVGDALNKTYEDISYNEASNDHIVRTTIEWFENGNTCDLAIIHFTEDERVEYIVEENNYKTCTPLGVENHNYPKDNYKEFDDYFENIFNPFIGTDNFYKNQYLLEHYFENKNIPYFFMQLKKWEDPKPSLWKDWCKNFPLVKTCCCGGLLGWKEKEPDNYDHNYNHHYPSEKGHQIIANYILDNIKDHF